MTWKSHRSEPGELKAWFIAMTGGGVMKAVTFEDYRQMSDYLRNAGVVLQVH